MFQSQLLKAKWQNESLKTKWKNGLSKKTASHRRGDPTSVAWQDIGGYGFGKQACPVSLLEIVNLLRFYALGWFYPAHNQ